MSKFLYAHISHKNGCYQHRILWPFRWTSPDYLHLDIDLSMTDPVGNYQYYLTHGSPPLNDFLYIGRWKRNGGKWILSIDDDYFSIPDWSTSKLSEDNRDLFYNCYDLADVIIVSTEALAKAVDRPHKTLVAPNLMQVDDYDVTTPALTRENELIRIVWAGSTTHSGDFTVAEPAINKILQKYKGRVEFIFMGYCPGNLMRDWLGRGVHYEQGTSLSLYPKVLKQMRPHITIAPLDDCKFNLSKSNIRVLEGWSLAAPVIASNVGEYKVVKDGVDGFLATTTEDWYRHLDNLISNQQLRETLGSNGRKRVAAEFDWANSACRKPWNNLIETLEANAFRKNWSLSNDRRDCDD